MLLGNPGTGFPSYMKITTPTMTVVIILRVQERISQAHESVFHFARRENGLEGNDFASGIDAMFSKRRSCPRIEVNDRLFLFFYVEIFREAIIILQASRAVKCVRRRRTFA